MNWRRVVGLTVATVCIGAGLLISNELLLGRHPRFGIDAYFQEVIKEADVAERFRGSSGHQIDDVTGQICDRVNAASLNGLGIPVDDRTTWPEAMGNSPKPMDIWQIYEDKGGIAACNDGIRDLQIEIDRTTSSCTARVRIWHAGCSL